MKYGNYRLNSNTHPILGLREIAGGGLVAKGGKATFKWCAAKLGRMMSRRSIEIDSRQLQSKYPKHASDFGVTGNWNPQTAADFHRALQAHVANPATKIISGTYRGQPVTHFYNPTTGLNVIRDSNGHFVSGWRLNPAQQRHLLQTGSLGGG